MFRCAKDIIRPPLQYFQNEAKYSGIMLTIPCTRMCSHSLKIPYYNVIWLYKTIFKIVKFGRVFVTIDIDFDIVIVIYIYIDIFVNCNLYSYIC
jgi:hypothetical protein